VLIRAAQSLAKGALGFVVDEVNDDSTIGQLESCLDRVGEPEMMSSLITNRSTTTEMSCLKLFLGLRLREHYRLAINHRPGIALSLQ
jgi:hypothetical protein